MAGSSGTDMLRVQDLTVRYGGVAAVNSVTLSVPEGAFAGLIGPNGAGKTTFIDAVCGLAPASGVVHVGDTMISGSPAHRRVRAGIGRTFQGLELFNELSVWENLLVAAESSRRWATIENLLLPRPSRAAIEAAEEALTTVGLDAVRDGAVSELSLGERKVVSVARALATKPSVLLLDEPAAGLDSGQSRRLGETLKALSRTGLSVLMVDHDMGLVLGVCDVVHVLDFGQLIASAAPAAIKADQRVVAAYLGEELASEASGDMDGQV